MPVIRKSEQPIFIFKEIQHIQNTIIYNNVWQMMIFSQYKRACSYNYKQRGWIVVDFDEGAYDKIAVWHAN